jgi:hypothetical protein
MILMTLWTEREDIEGNLLASGADKEFVGTDRQGASVRCQLGFGDTAVSASSLL